MSNCKSLEDYFYLLWRELQPNNMPKREYRFDSERRFRFDFAWLKEKIAVEIQGGTWCHGAHVRAKQYQIDCDKQNLATLQGWRVFCFTGDDVKKHPALMIEQIVEALNQ